MGHRIAEVQFKGAYSHLVKEINQIRIKSLMRLD